MTSYASAATPRPYVNGACDDEWLHDAQAEPNPAVRRPWWLMLWLYLRRWTGWAA